MKAAFLRQVPLLASLPTDEIDHLATAMATVEYGPGRIIYYEGEIGDRFSVIVAGQVEIIKALGTPDERILATLGPGDFLGELSLLRGGPRAASVRSQAVEPVRLLELTGRDFDALLDRQPRLALGVARELVSRLLASQNATIRDLQVKNRELAQAYEHLQAAQTQLIAREKFEHELVMARRIQTGLLPKELPALAGWRMAAHWQPAYAVGGDFYDFMPLGDGRLGLVVGDVSGKGVPAALVMATTRSTLRAAATPDLSPGELLGRVNDLLCADMPRSMFVTCLCAVLEPSSGRLRYANAGHMLPVRWSAEGVTELRATGMPLGLLPGMAYEESEAGLAPGEGVLFYSDGLVEAHDPRRAMFGLAQLRHQLAGAGSGPGLIAQLLGALAQFTGLNWEQEDDITLVTLQRLEPGNGSVSSAGHDVTSDDLNPHLYDKRNPSRRVMKPLLVHIPPARCHHALTERELPSGPSGWRYRLQAVA